MRKTVFFLIAALTLAFLFSSCQKAQNTGVSGETPSAAVTAGTDQSPDGTAASLSPGAYPDATKSDPEYSFTAGDVTLTLRENNLAEKLKALALAPVSDNTEILGQGSDTFTGSAVRTIDYGGLTLKLMAPKDALDNFGILQMTATDGSVKTPRGIAVGDTLKTLLDKYPEAAALDWDSTAYVFKPSGVDALDESVFTVLDGVVTKITMTYNLP